MDLSQLDDWDMISFVLKKLSIVFVLDFFSIPTLIGCPGKKTRKKKHIFST